MKLFYSPKTYILSIFLFPLFFSMHAQVGIGNTNPRTQLDVEGALSLREGTALTLINGLNSNVNLGTTPYSSYRISGPTADFSIRSITAETDADGQIITLVNTTTEDLTIVHNSGTGQGRIFCPSETDILITGRYSTITLQYNTTLNRWLLQSYQNGAPASDDWTTTGNAGTTAGTNFLGTTDGNALSFFTDNTEKLRISIGGHFRSFTDGTDSLPMFSWDTDRDTGFFRSGDDVLNFTTGGLEFIELFEGGDDEIRINDTGTDINFRVETNNNENTLFVDGGTDRLGFKTNNPQNDVHIAGNSTGIRVDAFTSANDANNNGVDVAPIYVDSNGDLTLEGPLVLNNMPEDNFVTFVPSTVYIGSPFGSWSQAAIYTTNITLTQDALVEVVYQIGVNITDFAGAPIVDGDPRQYGTALFIDTQLVGYTSEAYTSSGTGQITSGTFFLNGNGYAQLTGVAAGTTYTVTVYGFTFGADDGTLNGDSTLGEFGGNTGTDRFQLILHH